MKKNLNPVALQTSLSILQKLLPLLFFASIFFIIPLGIFGQENSKLQRANDGIVNVEFNTDGVDIDFILHNENFLGYKISGIDAKAVGSGKSTNEKNKKIFVASSKKKLQFYTTAPAKAKVSIFIPKDFLLESCRIQAINSKIKAEKIKAVYFVLSCTYAQAEISNSKFKNVLLACSHSKLNFSSGVVAVADFCINFTEGKIEIAEEQKVCNLFITQIKNNKMLLNGEPYTHTSLLYSPEKPKKYITMSAGFSDLAVLFVPPFKEPVENFNQYGISEFGPTPPPKLVDPVSNFLPKR